ncbi:MAG: GDP-mannose 4,6-dehydratase [Deltaproteobacteria bacterium]|nr:GDP-mannose 4,6-dehydratase [Deltaproteobacteria bacterium]
MLCNLDNLSALTPEQKSRFSLVKGDTGDRDCVDGVFGQRDLHAVVNFAAESHVDRSIEDHE